MKKFQWKHYINYIVIGVLTVVFAIISAAGGLKSSSTILLEKIAISIVLAVSLSLVVGFLGELSLGHAGFMCIGAYLGGKVASLLVPVFGNGTVTMLIALFVGRFFGKSLESVPEPPITANSAAGISSFLIIDLILHPSI